MLSRDYGEVRFISNCADDAALSAILDWKAQRFNAGKSAQRDPKGWLRPLGKGHSNTLGISNSTEWRFSGYLSGDAAHPVICCGALGHPNCHRTS